MAQLERPQRPVDASKTPTIHSMEQLLRAGEGSKSSSKGSKLSPISSKLSKLSPTYSSPTSSNSPSSPFFQRLRHHDNDEDHGQNHKKSVLTKVKEKAKKLRHSLSKKKHEDGNSPGAGLEDDGAEDAAENHSAPMYQSEMAHDGHKENEMQQPKASLVTSQKNVSSSNDKPRSEQDREKSLTRSMSKRTSQLATAPALATASTSNTIDASSSKTMNKTIAEKLTPSNNVEGSDAIHSITKLQGLSVLKPEEFHSTSSSPKDATQNSSMFISAPSTPPAKIPSQNSPSATARTSSASVTPQTSLATMTPQALSCSSAPATGKYASPTTQLWDKGVLVKEYLMNKLEPGEDEKALSQVISEAMSPRRTPGDAGVMEKVREAVTSLLRTEEPKKQADTTTATTTTTSSSSQTPGSTNAASTSSQIPVSTSVQGVVQEENRGRILQAN